MRARNFNFSFENLHAANSDGVSLEHLNHPSISIWKERRRRKLQNGIVPWCAHDAFAIKKICWRPKHSHSHTVHANVMKNLKCASFDNYRIESKPMKWKKKSGKMNIKPNCFIGMQWKEVSVVFNGTVSTWLWSSLISRS